jgi:aldose 1-epimerase
MRGTRDGIALFVGSLLVVAPSAAAPVSETGGAMRVSRAPFGVTPAGEAVDLYTLTVGSGMRVRLTNYGGIVVSLEVPDRDGKLADVVLGYDTLGDYVRENPYFGAITGRYANRIAGGRFILDGKEFRLATNDGANHLHGGVVGFDKVVWRAEPLKEADAVGVRLEYVSPDGEEGYPGTVRVWVTYRLTAAGELGIDYRAETDRATPLNLTHHSYFNLAGHASGNVLGHELEIVAARFTPVDAGLIPTGELRPVAGTPMDFRAAKPIGRDIAADDEQIRRAGGYDHNWVLDGSAGGSLALAARAAERGSGRVLEVYTTEPGMQFYSGNFLDGRLRGKGGAVYGHRAGFCLEAQHFPDSPHQPGFPSTILRPGQQYRQTTLYRFATR